MKPLEWLDDGNGGFVATGSFGDYEVNPVGFLDQEQWEILIPAHHLGHHDTAEQAKAAAEADYRHRILSTLSLPVKEPVAYRVRMDRPFGGVWQLRHVLHDWEKWDIVEPLFASPQPTAITEEMVERAISQAEMWNEEEGDPADTLHHGRSVIQKFRAALTAALKEA